MTTLDSLGGGALTLHPLRVPELARIICNFLDEEDRTSLLYLSRRIYATTLPIIWEDVEMQSLFFLIAGTTIKKEAPYNSKYFRYVFNFPATRDLTRFGIHAPLVKVLRALYPYVINFPGEWPGSGLDTTTTPLLPNLQSLLVHTFSSPETVEVDWIPRLWHPNLHGFEISSVEGEYYPCLDQDTYLDLINHISRICPRIAHLRLFLQHISRSDEIDCAKLYHPIASLRHLRSLTFTGTMVHELLFNILSQLPHLDTLFLCSDELEEGEHNQSPLVVPDDSFSSLRHLHLWGLNESAMSQVCKVAPLFHHLITVTIYFKDRYDGEVNERSRIAVTSLGRNSPHLRNFTIVPRETIGWFVVSWSILDRFKHMPLRSLKLAELRVDVIADREEADRVIYNQNNCRKPSWSDFLASVPQLEELELERQRLKPRHFALFALHLPKLRQLTFKRIHLDTAKTRNRTNHSITNTAQPIILRGRSFLEETLTDVYSEQTIHNAARFVVCLISYKIRRLNDE
ncbi:hypothetical protein FRC12_025038 [Ceratobasidium sp. 428]|nr:hypothetical protein FRC12_025038 [Ceratobasidium sp. 428]